MTFLKNCWYLAAWSDELVGDRIMSRMILNQQLVLFRAQSDGRPIALLDRCPHRFAPLLMGNVVGDAIQCGYHGLTFDQSGRCIANHFSSATPAAARVPSFHVVEYQNGIWLWPGDRDLADEALIPFINHQIDPEQACVYGLTHAKADYRLLSDNLMDLSHSAFLHPDFGGRDYLPKVRSWEDDERSVSTEFTIEQMPNFVGPTYPHEFIRNHDQIRWMAPGTHLLDSSIGPVGAPPDLLFHSAHLLTPETERSTHYFWSSGRAKDSQRSDDQIIAMLSNVFDNQDKPMVEAVQRVMGDQELWDMQPVLLGNDAGAVRVRRRLAALIEAETADGAPEVPASGRSA